MRFLVIVGMMGIKIGLEFLPTVRCQGVSAPIRKGNEAFKKGDYLTAAENYRKALNKEPDNATAAFNLGAALYRENKMDSTRQVLQETLRKSIPQELEAKVWHNLGNSFLKERKPQEAIEAYKKALKINPDDEDTRYNLAYAQRLIPPPSSNQQKQNKNQQKQNSEDKSANSPDDRSQKKSDAPRPNSENHPRQTMSKEEAEKLLQALLNKEAQNSKEFKENTKRSVSASGKDW